MPEREPRTPQGPSSITGSLATPDGLAEAGDSPTVRSGSGSVLGGASVAPFSLQLPLPGDRLGAFVLEASIGAGGMGAVFRATDDGLDRVVALKVLPPEQARDAESVRRFYQEGRAAARLDHENIARVYAIGHTPPLAYYIAFEFIDGQTIRQRVDGGGVLPVGEAIEVTLQVAAALVHSSGRGVVHRDVKPSNIILTPGGRAKLVDMGLARRFERGGDAGLTQTGMTLGTFDYISPEQARDPRSVDVRGDLYSLGCTLYFMLAGRPPFPDGTVLQKLLQHREEPPPDVRAINPGVPAGLSAIIVKLMAKDRDRRYQSPDQLVRDLQSLAAALDLRPTGPEGLADLPHATAPSAWERHLVWGVPALAFAVILGGLIWNSQPTDSGPQVVLPPEFVGAPARATPPAAPTPLGVSTPVAIEVPTKPARGETARSGARDLAVRDGDDLSRRLAEAPAGSTLVLVDPGPYDLRPGPEPVSPKAITLRAGIGVRPVVRLAPGAKADAGLDLKGGRLSVDGVEFHLDADGRDGPLAAIRSEDAELSVVRCVFRRVGTRVDAGPTAGLWLRSAPGDGPRLGVVVDACHFEGGQHAIRLDGPVDLSARDLTVAGASDSAFFCSAPDGSAGPASVRILRASVLLGEGPLLRSVGQPPRFRLDNSVVAPPGGPGSAGVAALVVADDPARLDWRGRDNLYHRLGFYLEATPGGPGAASFTSVRSYEAWADDPARLRESGSFLATARVWGTADPILALARDATDPSAAFRPSAFARSWGDVGARRGPSGVIGAEGLLATVAGASPARPGGARDAPPAPPVGSAAPTVPPPGPEGAAPSEPGDMPPPMNRAIMPDDEMPPDRVVVPAPTPGPDDEARPAASPAGTARADGEGRPVRTASELLGLLGGADGRGETLLIPADADWELPACGPVAGGSWTIRAGPGPTRPRIRFRPKAVDARLGDPWAAWVSIRSGSVRVEGVDIVLTSADAPRSGGWAAFSVASGADLKLIRTTVTIEGSKGPSAVVVVPPARESVGSGEKEAEPRAATLLLQDSLLRAGGDLVEVAADRRVDLRIENAVVSTGGSLLHGHGRAKGTIAGPIKATLRRLAARVVGGLVRLEGGAGDPELPVVEVVARDSVLTTDGGVGPLVRIVGEDDAEALHDRLRWDGRGVAYHQISTYRRDEVRKPGDLPTVFDRASWDLSVVPRELGSIHGEALLAADWPADRPAWEARPGDLKVRDDGQAARAGAGADLRAIPPAPPSRS